MEKQAFIGLLLNLIGKYGLGSVSKFLNRGVGKVIPKSAPGSLRRGLANTVGSAGKHVTDAAKFLGSRPVLSDALGGASMAALSGDEDSSFLGRAATEVPAWIGFGAGTRALGKSMGPWWDKMKTKRADIAPQRLSGLLGKLTDRTLLENSLIGSGLGTAAGAVSDEGPVKGLMHGAAIGAGAGGGALLGKSLGEKAISRFPAGAAKVLTAPAAGISGAIAGGLLAHKLYQILDRHINGATRPTR